MLSSYLSSIGSNVQRLGGPGLLVGAAMLMSWPATTPAQAADCKGDAAGITLPDGFCATIFADNIGHARQMAFAPDGRLYVNTWSGIYYNNGPVPAGGFVVALKDTDGDGHADVIERFGETVATGGHGGTGIAFYNGMVYAEINDRIVR
jgi:glucose/arabinose dehydrogenase